MMGGLRQLILHLTIAVLAAVEISTCANAADNWPLSAGPDPREIPVPAIATSLGTMPGANELPVRKDLPDVLVQNDGGRVASAADWPKRRTEIKRVLEYYAVGQSPPPPGNVTGREISTQSLLDGSVKYRLVHLTFGPNEQLALNIGIFTPSASAGPFPALIMPGGTPPGAEPLPTLAHPLGQGKGVDALLPIEPLPDASPNPTPSRSPTATAEDIATRNRDLFRRGYALVVFNNNDCAEDTTLRNDDGSWAFRTTRFYPAYPGYDWGILAGWAWGVSRIVDYLETDPAIDASKLIITGVSRTGKSAMVAAAFDDRIAMAAPCVTGGGGIGAYRFCGEGRGGKEGLDIMMKKYPNWFSPHLHEFWGHTDNLPFDNHWFLALVAPRPFLCLEGKTDGVSLANAVKQSVLGARPAYALLDATDQLGINYGDHGHTFNADDLTAIMDFADKNLRGMQVERHFDQFYEPGEDADNRVQLWNGRDLSGWKLYLNDDKVDPASVWRAENSVLRLDTKASGYIHTEKSYGNYHLHVEWRWPPDAAANSNSGVIVHINGDDAIWPASFECQLKNGNAGQIVGLGLDIPDAPLLNNRKRAPRLADPSEKPFGEWNSYDIYARGDSLEVFVNGVRQNFVEKLPASKGGIALQMEGFPIEFRNVWLQPY